jgi:hypothetical protein
VYRLLQAVVIGSLAAIWIGNCLIAVGVAAWWTVQQLVTLVP